MNRHVPRGTAARCGLIALAALGMALGACRRDPPPPPRPASPPPPHASSAHPPTFVHPQVPDEPSPEVRPECSAAALTYFAERIRQAQRAGALAARPGRKRDPRAGCGSPAMTALERDVKGALVDRVVLCVAKDGPLDAEWDVLSSALSSLGVCFDCGRTAPARAPDCQRALDLVNRAVAAAQAHDRPPAPAAR